jgi:metal-responsive CopG/Arc/MetJ family transcriptional regulator
VYLSGTKDVVAVHLPKPLIEQVDVAAADELRTRTNMIRRLVDEGLRRRAASGYESRVRSIHYQRGELTR